GYPIKVPVVDIVEIGNGGGSIAWIDDAGSLKVGPQSAGAKPGPVAYGRGGENPTTTDANLVTGRLSPENFQNTVDM
ncbi:hydantoinase/oxoprolinase family protein, partial [Microbacteriaceae bacterium K1510]|nr:hydantoinase/oxoprolinase family protein [Microbacteriaceae bacterium K1510]